MINALKKPELNRNYNNRLIVKKYRGSYLCDKNKYNGVNNCNIIFKSSKDTTLTHIINIIKYVARGK